MAGFETSNYDPRVAALLQGVDPQTVGIARSSEQYDRLNEFHARYIQPDSLDHTVDGVPRLYNSERISAVGETGSLLHIRQHEQRSGWAIEPSVMNLVIIGHLDDPNPATFHTATTQEGVRFDATRKSVFTIGQPSDPSLQAVERPMNELEWGIEQALKSQLAVAALPQVEITTNGWQYRRSDGHWEKLRGFNEVRRRVETALSRGLGRAAQRVDVIEQPIDYGQFEQKVLG